MKKTEGKIVNKADVILLAVILIAAILAVIILKVNKKNGNSIEIIEAGRVIKTMPLDEDDKFIFKSARGTNTVVVEDGQAYVINADCADKICEGYKPVSNEGDLIICLPHKLVVQVVR